MILNQYSIIARLAGLCTTKKTLTIIPLIRAGEDELSEHPMHEDDDDALSQMYMKIKMGQPVGGHNGEHQGHSLESVRKVPYKGHQIIVKTIYEIQVDGKPLIEHIDVGNNGSVHSHTFPNYSFPSTIDFVKKLIDKYPDSFQSKEHNHGGT